MGREVVHWDRTKVGLCVETTGLNGAGHAVETMDAISQALSLPVKIYLDEIDKLGNYEYIFP